MSRRNKKNLNNRAKVLIIIVILAICLFLMHRFNFLTKSETINSTIINFAEKGTEDVKSVSLEVYTDSNGNNYVLLPEKIDGYYVDKYYKKVENDDINKVDIDESEDTENIVKDNEISNNLTEQIDVESTNTINTNSISEDTSDAIQNTVGVAEKKLNGVGAIEDEEINVDKSEDTNTVSDITSVTDENSNTITNTIISENNSETDTNTSDNNAIVSENSQENEDESNQENSVVSVSEENDAETASDEENDYEELNPLTTYYLDDESYITNDEDNVTLTIEVEYKTATAYETTLYKRDLEKTFDDGTTLTITGFIPRDYELQVTIPDEQITEETLSGTDDDSINNSSILHDFDIKILDSENNEYQPIDYNQYLSMKISKEGNYTGKSLVAIHIKETDELVTLEKINFDSKQNDELELTCDEFSEYVILSIDPITDTTVTVDNYEEDYYYYLGKNYTDNISGENSNTYKEEDLVKVNVEYYSYDPSEDLTSINEITLSNVSFGKKTYTYSYRTNCYYDVTVNVSANSKKDIDSNKNWTMTLEVGDTFNLDSTKNYTGNSGKYSNISYDSSTITLSGENWDSWSCTDLKTYSYTFRVYYNTGTTEANATLSNPQVTSIERHIVGYAGPESPADGSDSERQQLYKYILCVPKDSSGNVSFEAIDNPYIDRPAGYGFNGWLKTESNVNIATDPSTFLQTITANTNGANEITIKLYVDWQEANEIFINTTSSNDNAAGTSISTAKKTFDGATTALKNNYKTSSSKTVSDRELNIIILINGNISNLTNIGKAYTVTSLYDGNDYRSTRTYMTISSSYTLNADLQLYYLNIDNSAKNYITGNDHSDSAKTKDNYIRGNSYNLRIGKGMVPLRADVNSSTDTTVTFTQVQGGARNDTKYKTVIESGKYNNVQALISTSGNTYKVNSILVLGNDYDKIKNNNNNLKVFYRTVSRATGNNVTPKDSNAPIFYMNVKSGSFGTDYCENNITNSKTYPYTYWSGIYVGGSSTTNYSDKSGSRILKVEGGNISNVIGGIAITSGYANNVKTNIYMTGGTVGNIFGGAGTSATYGDRIIQVTGGNVTYCVFGGSNGYYSNDSTSGQLNGSSLVYIGGNSKIGIENDSTSACYESINGNVYGSGNGNSNCSGSVSTSKIIINDNAKVLDSVYGGGNYGVISAGSASTLGVKIDILGGTIEKNVYAGANKNGVTGYTLININDGIIKGTVYGGSNDSGTTTGDSNININGGIIYGHSQDENKDDYDGSFDAVFGGGLGLNTTVNGNINLNIKDVETYKNNILIVGNVYGGSESGKVNANSGTATNINIVDNPSYTSKIAINGSLYGGGKSGTNTNSNIHNRDINIVVNGGNYNTTYTEEDSDITYISNMDIYGGANQSGRITGKISIKVGETTQTTAKNIYGGGNQADILANASTSIKGTSQVYVYLYENAIANDVYNGGNQASIIGNNTVTARGVFVQGAKVDNVYGGSCSKGTLTDTYIYCYKGAEVGNVFGAGKGENTQVLSSTHVNISNSSTYNGTDNFSKDKVTTITENVYGGGDAGQVTGDTNVTIQNSKVNTKTDDNSTGQVFGGGKGEKATVQNTTNVSIEENSIVRTVYGGGDAGAVKDEKDSKSSEESTYVYIYDSTVTTVFGGGKEALVNGNTSIDISNSKITYEENKDTNNVTGCVFGGGDAGEVTKMTAVSITNGSTVDSSVYGGGNEADVVGYTSVAIDNSTVTDVYGGGNQGGVNGSGNVGTNDVASGTSVSIMGSTITGNVYGGGNKGSVSQIAYVTIFRDPIADKNTVVKNSVFGAGKGKESEVNQTKVYIQQGTVIGNDDDSTAGNVYGGGDQGIVKEDTYVSVEKATVNNSVYAGGNGSETEVEGYTPGTVGTNTSVEIKSATIKDSVYAGGKGVTAVVYGNTHALSEGTTQIEGSLFGGGNAASTGDSILNTSLAIVDVAGGTIKSNVYGGANQSDINGSTVINIGVQAIADYYGTNTSNYEIGEINIGGTVFGGGEKMDLSKEFSYDSISVTDSILINIDGTSYETTYPIHIKGSIFGSGNASSANTDGIVNIKDYGTIDSPKDGISIQRCSEVNILNSALQLSGITDSTSAHSSEFYTLNRIKKLVLQDSSTLYLRFGANLLQSYYSLAADGTEETAVIKDTVYDTEGNSYESINGNIYDKSGNLKYVISGGIIYGAASDGEADKEEVIGEIDYTKNINATSATTNTDNRIYMYSGINLNIATDEDVTTYGEVHGMTYFGLYRILNGTESDANSLYGSNELYTGMYNSNYTSGGSINYVDRDYERAYVLGQHYRPVHDITTDGFFTTYELLAEGLDDLDEVTEENYSATSYVAYITPIPEGELYYMWYAGPDNETYIYPVSLIASKYSTLGTKEVALTGLSHPNAILKVKEDKNGIPAITSDLSDNVSLVDKDKISIYNDDVIIVDGEEKSAANYVFGLGMDTGNSGWSTTGSTSYYGTSDSLVGSYISTGSYVFDNSGRTPSVNFYFYHSNNMSEENENLGTYRVEMTLIYWKNQINYATAKVIFDVSLSSVVYDDNYYNGSITPGSKYELFTSSVTNITPESSFSVLFELAESDFLKSDEFKDLYEDSYRMITTEYAFPIGTTITMISTDYTGNKEYFYYDVETTGKTEYKLTEFMKMGSNNAYYDEKEMREKYYYSDKDFEYEEFIFIVDFKNAQFTDADIQDETIGLITSDNHFRMYLKTDKNASNSCYFSDDETTKELFGLMDDQISSLVYGIYDKESQITIDALLSKSRIYLGTTAILNVETTFSIEDVNTVKIYDTEYFNKKLGIKLTLYKLQENEDGTSTYNIVTGADLLGTAFVYGGKEYYPAADGTTRIKIAEVVSSASSNITIDTENSSLATGTYKIKIESFGSADGIYYGIQASSETEVKLQIINDVYGLKSTLPAEQAIIDKDTGLTLNENTADVSEDETANKLEFDLEYLSGYENPYITVSLYRRKYDIDDAYENIYEKVDLQDYVEETLELPQQINGNYTTEDELKFLDENIEKFENEYIAVDTNTIKTSTAGFDNMTATNFDLVYTLKSKLPTGTYKVVFTLYDANDTVLYETIDDGAGGTDSIEYDITEYAEIGDTFSYIIIK